jgi:hypothetical protein
MAEQIRLTDTERKALDFLIAALKEGDDTASMRAGEEAQFPGAMFRVAKQAFNAAQKFVPVAMNLTQRLGGRAGLTAEGQRSLSDVENLSLEEMLEELQRRSSP